MALAGLQKLGIPPEQAGWHMVDGRWHYGTSADVRRYDQPVNIDDTAAREWQRRGARLNIPPPTFGRDN